MSITFIKKTNHDNDLLPSNRASLTPHRVTLFAEHAARLQRLSQDAFPHHQQRQQYLKNSQSLSCLARLAGQRQPAEGSPGCFSDAMTRLANHITTNTATVTSSKR